MLLFPQSAWVAASAKPTKDTAKKMKPSIKDFLGKCDQICSSFQWICSYLLKKCLMEKYFMQLYLQRMVIVNDDLFNLKVTRINIAEWTESWHKIAVSTYITY